MKARKCFFPGFVATYFFPAKTTLSIAQPPFVVLYLTCMIAKTEDMPGIARGS